MFAYCMSLKSIVPNSDYNYSLLAEIIAVSVTDAAIVPRIYPKMTLVIV